MQKVFPFFFILAALFLGACSSSHDSKKYEPVIHDSIQALSEETQRFIQNFEYPAGFPLMVRSTDSVSKRRAGTAADGFFKSDAESHPRSDVFEKRGVYIFISQKPQLVQLRMGDDIKLQAQWNGLTAGSDYINIQQKALEGETQQAVKEFVIYTAKKLPQATELSGFKKFIYNDLTTFLGSELDAVSLPSGSFYGEYMLRPAIELRLKELSGMGGWWLSYIFLFVLSVIIARLLYAFFFRLLLPKAELAVKNTGKLALDFLSALVFAAPAVGSTLLLSGARMEDRLVLQEMGLETLESLNFQPDAFNSPTWWFTALLVFVLYMLKSFINKGDWFIMLTHSPQRQRAAYYNFRKNNPAAAFKQNLVYDTGRDEKDAEAFEETPYTWLVQRHFIRSLYFAVIIGFATYFFFPGALSLALIYFWIAAMLKDLFKLAKFISSQDASAENPDENIEQLSRKLAETPENPDLLIERAQQYTEKEDWQSALSDLNKAETFKPREGNIPFLRASVREELGLLNEAIADYDKAIELGADPEAALNNKALLYQKSGRNMQAAEAFTQLINQNPKMCLAYYNRGICYFNEQKDEKALADFAKAAKQNPDDKDIYRHRAVLFERREDYKNAAEEYTQALAFDRTDAALLYHRAGVYEKLNKLNKAESDYSAIEEIHTQVAPSDYYPAALKNRAKIYNTQKNYKDAVKDYTALLSIEAAAEIFLLRGIAYTKIQDYEAALNDFNQVLENDPNNVSALSMRGGIYVEKNDSQAAVADFEKALKYGMNKHPQIMDYLNKHRRDEK